MQARFYLSVWIALNAGGLIAAPSIDCTNIRGQQEIDQCAELEHEKKAEYEQTDRELNHIYRQLISQIKPEFHQKLRSEQRAWIKQRDDKCQPKMGLPAFYECLSRTTTQRIDEMRSLISDIAAAQRSPGLRSPLPFDPKGLEYPSWAREKRDKARVEYCETLLGDLKKGTDVHFVDPIDRVETIQQLKSGRWFGRCSPSEFAKTVEFEGRVWDSIKDLPKQERERYGRVYRMVGPFMLYRVDIDRNSKNGEELILYGAGQTDDQHTLADSSSLMVLDLKRCETKYHAQVVDVGNYPENSVG